MPGPRLLRVRQHVREARQGAVQEHAHGALALAQALGDLRAREPDHVGQTALRRGHVDVRTLETSDDWIGIRGTPQLEALLGRGGSAE